MRLDLELLVWATALTLLQGIIAAVGTIPLLGLPAVAGNRENLPPIQGWAGRAQRAHRNMLESLVLFAALVLVAHAAGRSNAMTVLGAQLFFWARLAYAPIYIAGIAWLRTGVWTISIIGLALIFLQLL